MDRGVLNHLVCINSPQLPSLKLLSRSILAKDARVTWIAKPVPTTAAQWVLRGVLPWSIAFVSLTNPFFAIQIGDWDVSQVENFDLLFIPDDDYYNPFPGSDTFNEPINWDTGTWSLPLKHILPPTRRTPESEYFVGSAKSMMGMFQRAYAFNQPLPTFDTSKVTNVSVFLC